jgi:hypothetical protein
MIHSSATVRSLLEVGDWGCGIRRGGPTAVWITGIDSEHEHTLTLPTSKLPDPFADDFCERNRVDFNVLPGTQRY